MNFIRRCFGVDIPQSNNSHINGVSTEDSIADFYHAIGYESGWIEYETTRIPNTTNTLDSKMTV